MTDSPSGENRPTNMWEELNRPKDRGPESEQHDEERDDKAGIPLAGVIGGAVAVAAVAFAGFIVLGGGDDIAETQEAAVQAEQLALEDADEADRDAIDGDADSLFETEDSEGESSEVNTTEGTVAEEPTGGEEPAEESAYSPAVPAGAEGSYSVLSQGKLYLRGEIPSPLIEIGAVNALEEIMGEGNVISEYVINPDAPFEMGRATDVFIEDTVLFEFGSAEIAPDFYPLLGLGVVLMDIQDGVTIEVYGHTDSAGSDETNLALSQARVDAVEAFWVSQGADPDRITAIGKGEAEPVADNSTPEGQQLNRRVEIVITGFVFSL